MASLMNEEPLLCRITMMVSKVSVNVCVSNSLCLTLCDPMDCVVHQAPLSMGFPRQEYWSGLPSPSPGDLPYPGIRSGSPALQADPLPPSHQGSSYLR